MNMTTVPLAANGVERVLPAVDAAQIERLGENTGRVIESVGLPIVSSCVGREGAVSEC